jgi:hypothetical protein
MKFTDTLKELEAKATDGPWRKSKGNIGNGIEGYCGKKSPIYEGDDGYRMVGTYQSCKATEKYSEEAENQKANGDLIIYLRNHAKEIIKLVEAAQAVHVTSGCSIADLTALSNALESLNKD